MSTSAELFGDADGNNSAFRMVSENDAEPCPATSPTTTRRAEDAHRVRAAEEGYSYIEWQHLVYNRNQDEIGHGTFGTVYRATWAGPDAAHGLRYRGMELAVKVLPGNHRDNTVFHDDVEVNMMSQLSHRNVVRFHGVAFSPEDETLIVTEFCLNGSLRACMDKGLLDRIPFSAPREEDQSLLKFAIQILSGLRYLHDDAATTVVHRDLKSANVLVTKDWVMKIADFGSAKKKTMHLQTFAGTPAYMAPEMLRQDEDKMGTPGDIWSYGVVLWELITLEMPHSTLIPPIIIFGGGQGLLHLPVPLDTPETIQELLAGCWKVEPDDRPTASKLLRRLDVLNEEQESEASLKMVEVIRSRSRWQDEVRERMYAQASQRAADYRLYEQNTETENDKRQNEFDTFVAIVQEQAVESQRLRAGLGFAFIVIVLLIIAVVLKGGDTTDASTAFNQANLNNDTEITQSEISMLNVKSVFETLGINVDSDEELLRILERYDTNHDSSNTALDRTEFQDLVAGETSAYSHYRAMFIENFGISKAFSLSATLRQFRDYSIFSKVGSALFGVGFLLAPLVVTQQWMIGRRTITNPMRTLVGGLILGVLGTVCLAVSMVDTVFASHFGTRELVRFAVVIEALWAITAAMVYVAYMKPRVPRAHTSGPWSRALRCGPSSGLIEGNGGGGGVFDTATPQSPPSNGGSVMASQTFQTLPPNIRQRFLRRLSQTEETRQSSRRRSGSSSPVSPDNSLDATPLQSARFAGERPSPLKNNYRS